MNLDRDLSLNLGMNNGTSLGGNLGKLIVQEF